MSVMDQILFEYNHRTMYSRPLLSWTVKFIFVRCNVLYFILELKFLFLTVLFRDCVYEIKYFRMVK